MRLARFFDFAAKQSSFQVEVLAGLSTFLSLSYIFVVNPAILSQAGMDKSAVLFATIMASAVATIVMGLWPNLPFVLAPGMELNAYVAFFVVGSLGFNWRQALGAVFWSGVLFIVLTLMRIRRRVIDAIPERMKAALAFSVGVFLFLVALKIAGLLRYDGVQLVGLGRFTSRTALVFYTSLVFVLLLEKFKVRGSVLISILIAAGLCHVLELRDPEQQAQLSRQMLVGIGALDLGVIVDPRMLSVILILFLIDFYGSIAKFVGLSLNTSLVVNGQLPQLKNALLIDGAATVFGSTIGTSSIIVYVESAVGIGAGGRTGLTAVTCGILMLGCFALSHVLGVVPIVATTGALAFVGIKLFPSLRELRTFSAVDNIALILMPLAVIGTFAIDRAMLVGFSVYALNDLIKLRKANPYIIGSIILLALGAYLQMR